MVHPHLAVANFLSYFRKVFMKSIGITLKKYVAIGFCAAMALTVAGCNEKKTTTEQTNLRLVNLAPENGSLAVQIGDDPVKTDDPKVKVVISNVAYQGSSGYTQIDSGSGLRVRVTGTTGTIVDTKLTLAGKAYTTIYIYGGTASISSAVTADVENKSTTTDNFKIRLANYGIGVPTMDMYLLTSTENLTDALPVVRSVGARSMTDYIDLASKSRTLKLTEAGTKDVIFDSDAYTFEAGKTYLATAYSNGSSRLTNLVFQVVNEDGAKTTMTFQGNKIARVRALNGSNDSGPMALKRDTDILFSSIPYQGASGYKNTASGNATLRAEQGNTPGTATATATTSFIGGTDYTVVLSGSVLQNTTKATVYPDQTFLPPFGKARVRFINATEGIGAIDAYANFSPVANNIAQNTASKYVELNAATTIDYTVNIAGQGSSLVVIPPIKIEANLVYTVFIVGQSGFLKGVVRQDN
jgi:hypothetical protein